MLHDTLAAAAEAGFDSVWLRSDGGPDAPTVAGALLDATGLFVGVLATVGAGRLPSIVARELATLDVLSSSGVGVLFEGGDGPALDGHGLEQLLEAVAVCRALFGAEPVSFAGRHFALHDAVHRPGPVHPGSPVLLVSVGGGLVGPGDVGVVRSEPPSAWPSAPAATTRWRGALDGEPGTWASQVRAVVDAGGAGVIVHGTDGAAWPAPPDPRTIAEVGRALGGLWD
jgi:Luciferase-like monooxygenase